MFFGFNFRIKLLNRIKLKCVQEEDTSLHATAANELMLRRSMVLRYSR